VLFQQLFLKRVFTINNLGPWEKGGDWFFPPKIFKMGGENEIFFFFSLFLAPWEKHLFFLIVGEKIF
jgi:hypothetical protein